MEKGVTVFLNGTGYYFSDYELLAFTLDTMCDKTIPYEEAEMVNGVAFNEEDSEGVIDV